MAKALTVKKVQALIRAGVRVKHTDGDVKGLMLCVESKTSASWLYRYQIDYVVRHLGLGSALDIARDDGEAGVRLADARKRALQARDQIANGVDPLEEKRKGRQERETKRQAEERRLTFKQAAERYHAAHAAGWSSAQHADEFFASLERWAFPLIGDVPVGDIGKDQALQVLEQPLRSRMGKSAGGATFWEAKTITADRVRNRCQRVLDWAEARDFRPAMSNPFRWKGFLDKLLPRPRKVRPVEHMASVPYAQVPALMQALAADQSVGAQVVRLIVYTACRLSEALKATWDEFDLEASEWTIPAARMKGRREHRVPLASAAVELLRSLYREEGNPYLFIGSTPGMHIAETTVTDVLRRAGRSETIHGMRASFKTWAEEQTNFPGLVIELSLAHRVGDATEDSYRRGDVIVKRRMLMEAWANFCIAPPADAAVLPMRRPVR
jgi:integrase